MAVIETGDGAPVGSSDGEMGAGSPVGLGPLYFLRSDGTNGSYAQTATNAAARVIFDGDPKEWCLLGWFRAAVAPTNNGIIYSVDKTSVATPRAYLVSHGDGTFDAHVVDNGGITDTPAGLVNIVDGEWHAFAINAADALSFATYEDGVVDDNGAINGGAGAYPAADTLTFFADKAFGNRVVCDLAGLAVFPRQLAPNELLSLAQAGPAWRLDTATGDYAAGSDMPSHWWPGQAIDGEVSDEGLAGGCALLIFNGVTSESEEGRDEGGEAGDGSPVTFSAESPEDFPIALREAFQSDDNFTTFGFDPAYSDDGGQLCEAQAAWPSGGPFRVQLRSQAGVLYPEDDTGCYGGVAALGDEVYANASRRILRFAIPRVPRGTYDLVFTWAGGVVEKATALRVVPRMIPRITDRILRAMAVGTWMERDHR